MFEPLVLLIPALPLAAALVNGASLFAGDKLHYRTVQNLTCGAALLSFIATIVLAAMVFADPVPREVLAWRWLAFGDTGVDIAFLIDALSVVMMLVVTGFGWLIALFSRNYMHKDRSFTRYFAALALFLFAMLVLVMGNNFVLLFLGWEAVGLCSYLLIGHYYERNSAARAGTRAFLMNRVGDAGFLLGIFAIAKEFGSVNYREVFAAAPSMDSASATVIALCLLLGAIGKSAQLPLGTWLARAMEGPTPSSALIHAATMVTAGVYMIVRAHSIYDAAPNALLVVALVGLATALYGALVGQTLSDIKGILAASTTTQLGLMFVACGLGAYTVAIFHLVAHAFLKSYLFLTAPSILHHLHGKAHPAAVQQAETVPHWSRLVPAGVIVLLVIALGVAWWQGAPLGLAGAALLAAGALSVLVTLQHLGSLSRRAFDHGGAPDDAHGHDGHSHGPSLVGPALGLALLIALGAAAGLLPGVVEQGWFGQLLAPAIGTVQPREANFLIVLAVAGALALAMFWSWLSATRMERFAAELPGLDMLRLRSLYAAAMHRFWLDEAYERYLAGPSRRLGAWLERIDIRVIDRISGSATPASRVDTADRVWEERVLGARAASGGERNVLAWLQAVSERTERGPQPAELPRGAVGWLTQTAAADAAWVEREVIGRASGVGGWLTQTASADAAWIEREVIGRASGLVGRLATVASAVSDLAERLLFGRAINDGAPYAGAVVGHWFERLEPKLLRPVVAYVLLAAGVAAAIFLGV